MKNPSRKEWRAYLSWCRQCNRAAEAQYREERIQELQQERER